MAEPRRKLHLPHGISSAVILFSATAVFAVFSLFGSHAEAADRSVWRELLRIHDRIRLAIGSAELGDIYITGNRLLRLTDNPTDEVLNASAEAVNSLAAESGTPFYLLTVPTSAGIYREDLPDAAPIANEHLILRRFSGMISDQITQLESVSWLSAEREQYIYYRTDPCWTGYGAFCIYRSAIRRLGFTAIGYDRFSVTHCRCDYYGRLSQEAHYYDVQPDLVDIYTVSDAAQTETVTALRKDGAASLPSYFLTEYSDSEPEFVFASAKEPVLRIETENQSSKDLLLLTDTFGVYMIPFLMQHYRTVTAVNLTLTEDLDWRTLTKGEYSQILLLCGADTVISQEGLPKMLSAK